jgi:DNA-binding NarL/FixJ family response regulator
VPLRLLLVDDDDRYLDGLVALLGVDDRFEIVGRAHNGAEAVGFAAALQPDVVVMDIDMPVMNGLEATRLIHERHPPMGLVLVSGSEFAEGAFQLLDSITVDDASYPYLTKTRVPNELVDTILRAGANDADPRLSELHDRYSRGELSLDDLLQATAELAGTPGSPEPPPEGEN